MTNQMETNLRVVLPLIFYEKDDYSGTRRFAATLRLLTARWNRAPVEKCFPALVAGRYKSEGLLAKLFQKLPTWPPRIWKVDFLFQDFSLRLF